MLCAVALKYYSISELEFEIDWLENKIDSGRFWFCSQEFVITEYIMPKIAP